jgi:hypothetical protein
MVFKVFYAWQSDRSNKLCRGLIRRALDAAASKLNSEIEVTDAERRVQIDQDTDGVSGSPSVTETILGKIRECDAFVADLTFTSPIGEPKPSPNPNVLIEYGYALHALGDRRIVGVFNNSFGSPKDLPFDLQHKRWPLRYTASHDDDSDEAKERRNVARKELAADLTKRIGDIVRSHSQERLPGGTTLRAQHVQETKLDDVIRASDAQFELHTLWREKAIGVRGSALGSGPEVQLLDGPSIFLNMRAAHNGLELSDVETQQIVNRSLRPLASERATGTTFLRNRFGSVTATIRDDAATAHTASLLTKQGEIFGIDRYHLQVHRIRETADFPYIPTGALEELLIDGLINYLDVAKHELQLKPPLAFEVGIIGVTGFCLAVDPSQFSFQNYVGLIHVDSIVESGVLHDYDVDPFDRLSRLFEKIYDAAGETRPHVRTTGRRQR